MHPGGGGGELAAETILHTYKWYLGSANSLHSHSCFIRATAGGMCAQNLVLGVNSEKKAVLDTLQRQAAVTAVQLISKYY